MRTLPAFTSAPLHAITVFFLLAKTVSRFFPFGGSHSVNTNTGTVTVVCWSVASFSAVGCQTNLTGVPSQGQCWERIETVKMATVTGSWHSLYLGMMSTFDIVWPCPEIIIPQLNSTARHRSPLVMNISLSHLLSHLHLTFISVSPPRSLVIHPCTQAFFHSLVLFGTLSIQRYSSSFICSRYSPSPRLSNQLSLLFLAESGLYSCSHNLSTFHSLSLLLCPSTCQLFLTFCRRIPLNASVFLHRLHFFSIHPRPFFFSCTPAPDLPSILSRASDEARE